MTTLVKRGGDSINDTFKDLNKDKQQKILNAAFEEFACQGFKKASTNSIVKKAGISKGMLFYYFNSKKELYYDLVDYGITFMRNEILNLVDENQFDFIEKYRQLSKIKLKTYKEHQALFHFFANEYLDSDELSTEYIDKMLEIRALAYSKLYANIDASLFRKDIPAEKAIQIIKWCMVGYEKDLTNNIKTSLLHTPELDYEPYWEEYYNYLDTLKTIFYVKED